MTHVTCGLNSGTLRSAIEYGLALPFHIKGECTILPFHVSDIMVAYTATPAVDVPSSDLFELVSRLRARSVTFRRDLGPYARRGRQLVWA